MNVAFIQGIGPLELSIVLVIVLLIFGPKRLPGVARSVGSGMREFKDSLTGGGKGDDEETTSPATRAALSPSEAPAPAASAPVAPVTVNGEPLPAEPVPAQPVATERR